MLITNIHAREILDSRGIPTVLCTLTLDDCLLINASVPAGISVSKYEAKELRDGGKRLAGQGVLKIVRNINEIIAPKLVGKEPNAVQMDLELVKLDGTESKEKLGANSTLPVSMALYRAHAQMLETELFNFIALVSGSETVSLPVPMINLINGGAHADNNLDIQDYLLIPYASQNMKESIESSLLVFYNLEKLLKSNNKSTLFGQVGGFASDFENNIEPLDFILEAIEQAGFESEKFLLGLDVAASHFYDLKKEKYYFNGKYLTADDLIEFYSMLLKQYNLYSIEDGIWQDDINGWVKLTEKLGKKMCIIADDIFSTNPARIAKGIEYAISNSVVIKPNQIGTITETLQAIQICQENGLSTITSHRAGDTCDDFIVDLAVGASTNYIKCGGFQGSERTSKYNRLLEIESILHGMDMNE